MSEAAVSELTIRQCCGRPHCIRSSARMAVTMPTMIVWLLITLGKPYPLIKYVYP